MTDLKPFVVVPQCDVPAGKMPAAAAGVVRRALELGLSVRSTYAVALDPGRLRRVVGFERSEGGEGDAAKGGSTMRVTVTLETIAVRVREIVTGWAAYLIWSCVDGGSWSMSEAAVRDVGALSRRVSWSGIYI